MRGRIAAAGGSHEFQGHRIQHYQRIFRQPGVVEHVVGDLVPQPGVGIILVLAFVRYRGIVQRSAVVTPPVGVGLKTVLRKIVKAVIDIAFDAIVFIVTAIGVDTVWEIRNSVFRNPRVVTHILDVDTNVRATGQQLVAFDVGGQIR